MVTAFNCLWTLGLVIGCQILSSSASDSASILMWSHGNSWSFKEFNPFHKTTHEELNEIVRNKLENSPPLLVIVKDSFCVEDITDNVKNLLDQNSDDVIELPLVQSPYSFFKNLSTYVNLTMEKVKTMDDAVKTYKNARESIPNLVTVITGNYCNYTQIDRSRRATEPNVNVLNETALFFNQSTSDGDAMLYSSQYPFIKHVNGTSEQLTSLSTASTVVKSNNSVLITLMFSSTSDPKITTKFTFTLSQGYYKLTSLAYSDSNNTKEIQLFGKKQLFIPRDFSYHCGQETIFQSESILLNFTDLQFQLDAKGKFGDAQDCVGFTTVPIWTGIFVTAILGLILIWGLTMIVDIRTMDRFDDPKGKTITISAQE